MRVALLDDTPDQDDAHPDHPPTQHPERTPKTQGGHHKTETHAYERPPAVWPFCRTYISKDRKSLGRMHHFEGSVGRRRLDIIVFHAATASSQR